MRRLLTLALCVSALVANAADRRAPGFSLGDSKGVFHDLYDYRGKPVLLAMIQTTCPHCATFAEALQRVQEKYGNRVAILAVVTPPDDLTKVRQFIAGHKLGYDVVMDMGQMCYSYVLSPNLQFPRLYIIDANGMIQADHQYSPLTKEIFEGDGLMPIVGRMLNASTPAKK